MQNHNASATVPVGMIDILDAGSRTVIEVIARAEQKKRTAYAMHVGALHSLTDVKFVAAMQSADVVYADGAAVVVLARVAGGKKIERAATTDIGLPLLMNIALALNRPVRVVIIGGEMGVADDAASALEAFSNQIEIVLSTHGFHENYSSIFGLMRETKPDVVIVGLGMPYEAKWVAENYADLPEALIFTCGGWLGFLAGNELRAPKWMQLSGLEWLFRLSQSPQRLWRRYIVGIGLVVRLLPAQFRARNRVEA